MGLKLQDVPGSAGARWVRQGFAECFKQPMGYASLFLLFLFTTLLVAPLPGVGGVLMLGTVPLLTLAFVMAGAGAQQGLPVRVTVYLAPWRGAAPRQRRDLLTLCVLYAASTLALLALCDLIDGGEFDQVLASLASGQATPESLQAQWAKPQVMLGAWARMLLTTLLSVPFWHAPMLVVWGGQGPAQALFSSVLGVWRARAAFLGYGLSWLGAVVTAGVLSALLLAVLGGGPLSAMVVMPLGLFFTTAFYASLYFCFADSFATDEPARV